MSKQTPAAEQPVIGILGWEDIRTIDIYGSIAAPGTFAFPVMFMPVSGACYETVIARPQRSILAAMIAAARHMEQSGVKAITTSCGFNAVFQSELAAAVSVPVVTSTLILIPFIIGIIGSSRRIGIITADKNQLTRDVLEKAGVPGQASLCVYGIEETAAYPHICKETRPELVDRDRFRGEVLRIAESMAAENSDLGAIVLECTILHVFAHDIKRSTGVPVFDIVALTNYLYSAIAQTSPPC